MDKYLSLPQILERVVFSATCTKNQSKINQRLFRSIVIFGMKFPKYGFIYISHFNYFRPMTRQYAKRLLEQDLLNLPENGTFGPGCRKDTVQDCHEVIKGKKYTTTAGIICIVRPCMVRLGLYEVRF